MGLQIAHVRQIHRGTYGLSRSHSLAAITSDHDIVVNEDASTALIIFRKAEDVESIMWQPGTC